MTCAGCRKRIKRSAIREHVEKEHMQEMAERHAASATKDDED